jgi:CheY-like chemotaxis protein
MARILIIDADVETRTLTRLDLEAGGHQVVEAHRGEEGVEALRVGTFEAVVLDVAAACQDALETLGQIRQLWPDLAVVAVGTAGPECREEMLRVAALLGADEILTRPFESAPLLAALTRALAERRQSARATSGR